ncbi:flavodoxin domain-containing protein [Levilactobacillus brevis]|uniref:Probable flavodoxin-1 n=1 Tax=Levilactobacillus brevis KB290 TaxID=1001583 RepID=M5AAS2_LEVBR|nr:flavodoxin domain-containing protein [Levilactobacillus brevis]ARW21163.1 putative flavodoxin-1 [Levilactobacillus brevis]ARW51752.1 putative flavodoxin-1 [Levilactobacillus brevis]MCT2886158.1 flavodoxin [Levilactobacillus brevis]MCT3587251.1 flavodoxin [Levilactobacillus brevis]PUD97818.1 flavodoxin [Levilactobacillus brevis]
MTSAIQIIYASQSGRNQAIAGHLQAQLASKVQTVVTEISQADAFALSESDAIILVTYTYHDGDLPDEAQDFFEDLKEVDLARTKFAVLGSSSKTHIHFGRAVDYLTMQLNSSNGEQVADSVKIDQDPDDADWQRVDQLAQRVLTSLA